MKVAFRTDSSLQIGSGHVMRCLTLADELRQRGADVMFVCREYLGNMIGLIEAKGYPVGRLAQAEVEYDEAFEDHAEWLGVSWQQDAADTITALRDADPQWLIIDHYALDRRWEEMLRPYVIKIMVIDDLANRQHDCELLLDQNYYRNMKQRYKGLVPEHCITLLGPANVLLRPEFSDARKRLRVRDGHVRRILVFFGGSDTTNQTQKVLEALKLLAWPAIEVDVVVGIANPKLNILKGLCAELPNVTFHCQVSNMAELILNADLGVGAGGSAMWERCSLGLPTITVVFASNQERTTEDVAAIGAITYLGWSGNLEPADYAHSITFMIDHPETLRQISSAALGVLHSVGTAVVADTMHYLV